jgi:hypothetical protein
MQLPSVERVRELIAIVEEGQGLHPGEAKELVALVYSLMTPDHTWWRPPPIPHGQIMLLANNETLTPPMVFRTADEAAMFAQMNQTQLYIPIPKPPCLNEDLRAKAANN